MVMMGKARELREMGSVIPTLQRFVCKFLIRVADVAGYCSEPDLESLS
jgi:hypothetical protein